MAYPCLQHDDDDLPTLVQGGEAPSLIAIPAWPPKPQEPAVAKPARRVADAFPIRSGTSYAPPTAFRQAPHELSPFGRSQRLLSSRLALIAAYVVLGASAFWAAWSVARFL